MKKNNLIYWLTVLSILLIILDYFGFLKAIKSRTDRVIISIKQPVYRVKLGYNSVKDVFWQYSRLKTLLSEATDVKRVNEELTLKNKLLTDENSRLRNQLEIPLPPSSNLIPAQILGFSRFLEIGKGEKDGIKVGMPAVLGNIILGKVVSTTNNRTSIMLVDDREMQILVKTSRGTLGVAVGQGEKAIRLEKVLQKDPLFIDDQIVTTGLDGLPANLLLGKIVYINADDSTPYKQAKIESFVNLNNENMIFIIAAL